MTSTYHLANFPFLVLKFFTHSFLAVNVAGSSICFHFYSWRNPSLPLIIFLDTWRPLDSSFVDPFQWDFCNSGSNDSLLAPSRRVRLQLPHSNLPLVPLRSTSSLLDSCCCILRQTVRLLVSILLNWNWSFDQHKIEKHRPPSIFFAQSDHCMQLNTIARNIRQDGGRACAFRSRSHDTYSVLIYFSNHLLIG